MVALKVEGEQQLTKTPIQLYAEFAQTLQQFSGDLQETKCRKTRNFHEDIASTMAAFKPLFAPWNMEILFYLYMHGNSRFSALKTALKPVSSRVLTDKLGHLVQHGFLLRVQVTERHVEYSLTQTGHGVAMHLHPMLFMLRNTAAQP